MIAVKEIEEIKERIKNEIITEIKKKDGKNVDAYIRNKINEEMGKLKDRKEKEIEEKIKELMKKNEDAYISLSMLNDKINVITDYINDKYNN